MDIQIEHRVAFASATISLEEGEKFVAENGSMIAMSDNMVVETSSMAIGGKGGGILGGIGRMLGGESFFNNVFYPSMGSGEVMIAPALVGDIVRYDLNGELIVQAKSWLGSSQDVSMSVKWGGLKSFFGGEGFLLLRLSGNGPVLFNAFGAIHEVEIDGSFIIDTGHMVAYEPTLDFKIKKVGSWFSTIFSGEGLVCEFSGRGKLWMQTRNPNEFGQLIGSKLPPRQE